MTDDVKIAATATPEPAPEIRPGMKTSEFVITILMVVLGSVLASGLIVNNTALQLAGVAMATLKAVSYTWSRTVIKTAAMLVLLVGLAHTTTACGGGQRLTAIATTLHTLNAGKAAFLVFDDKHELDIVSNATSHEDGDKKLADYQRKRDLLNKAFAVGYQTVEDAAAIDDDHSVAGMVKAAAIVAQQLTALGIKP